MPFAPFLPLPPLAIFGQSPVMEFLAAACLVVVAFLVFLILFEPGLEYEVQAAPVPLDSDRFVCLLAALTDAAVRRDSTVEVLTNGEVFYEAQLEAIRRAKTSVNLEAYIFYKGEVTRRYLDALTERARAGVKVKVVVDAIGSFATRDSYFADLKAAGGKVQWYQPIRWYTFKRFNNRTHRELMVVDGRVGFIGGAGIADQWLKAQKSGPRWRDTVVRVEGSLVVGLQTTFLENWLEASGEILSGGEYFPDCVTDGAGGSGGGDDDGGGAKPTGTNESQSDTPGTPEELRSGLVVISSPGMGRSTRARILFQTLLASARNSIHINSPYFLPDRSTRRELIKAAKERGVRVQIITPGPHADHALTRASGRTRFGELLKEGVRISEYQPAMIHAKILIIDGVWGVVGSTNFDNRSFGLNDEVNLAAADRGFARRLEEDFANDLAQSKTITYEDWKRRPMKERLFELLGRVIERQQ
jgi:cardiolipin synthase